MTIYIVDIEAVDTRYTKQWKEHPSKQLQRATNEEVCYKWWRNVLLQRLGAFQILEAQMFIKVSN